MKFLALTILALVFAGSAYAADTANPAPLPDPAKDNCVMVTKWSKEFADKVGDMLTDEEKAQVESMGGRVLIVSKKVAKQMGLNAIAALKHSMLTAGAFIMIYGKAVDAMLEHLGTTIQLTIDQAGKVADHWLVLGKQAIADMGSILGNWLAIQGLNIKIVSLHVEDFFMTAAAKAILGVGLALADVNGTLLTFAYKASNLLTKFVITMNEVFLAFNIAVASVVMRVEDYMNKFLNAAIVATGTAMTNAADWLAVKEAAVAKVVLDAQKVAMAKKTAEVDKLTKNLGLKAKDILGKVKECPASGVCVPDGV